MEWNKRKEGEEEGTTPVTLLVCCSEGSMALVTLPPTLLGIDTTHSYHLSSVKVVSRSFVSIKDRLKVRIDYCHQLHVGVHVKFGKAQSFEDRYHVCTFMYVTLIYMSITCIIVKK